MDGVDEGSRAARVRKALATWAAAIDPPEEPSSTWSRYWGMSYTLTEAASLVRWPGEPGALAASVELVPLGLVGVPPAPLGIDVSPAGSWIVEVGDTILTSAGVRVPRDRLSVAWVGDDAFIASTWGRTRLYAADGTVLGDWTTRGCSIVTGTRIVGLDLEDDPNGGDLMGWTVHGPDGSELLERRFGYGYSSSQVVPTPSGGVAVLSEESTDVWILDDPWSEPRHFDLPWLLHLLRDDRIVVQALGDDAFALIGPEQVWAWRAGDRAMTLIHEGRLWSSWTALDPAGRSRRLGDRGVVVERRDGWWLVGIR